MLQRTAKGTAEQTKMFEQCTALRRHVIKFRSIQVLYMLIVSWKVAADPSFSAAPQHINGTPLYLPSVLSPSDCELGCKTGLADAELQLRKVQCHLKNSEL